MVGIIEKEKRRINKSRSRWLKPFPFHLAVVNKFGNNEEITGGVEEESGGVEDSLLWKRVTHVLNTVDTSLRYVMEMLKDEKINEYLTHKKTRQSESVSLKDNNGKGFTIEAEKGVVRFRRYYVNDGRAEVFEIFVDPNKFVDSRIFIEDEQGSHSIFDLNPDGNGNWRIEEHFIDSFTQLMFDTAVKFNPEYTTL